MDFTTVSSPVVSLIYKGRLRRKIDPLVSLPEIRDSNGKLYLMHEIDTLLKEGKSILIKVE